MPLESSSMAKIEDIYALQIRTLDDVKGLLVESKTSIAELHQEILDEVIADTTLADLNSTSNVSIWRLWAFITAMNIWLHEFNWIRYRVFLEEAVRFAQPHNTFWYHQRALEYQHGDSVTVVNGAVIYDPIVPANRIIAAASVIEANGGIIIKVAKLDSGELAALDSGEYTGFSDYVDAYKDAGVSSQVVSQNPDVLKLIATVYYNPSQTSQAAFQIAIEVAVTSFVQNLPFDGIFRRVNLIDAMQKVKGFVDVDITTLQASVAYVSTPLFQSINISYNSVAGYMNVDGNYPLSSNLTYFSI